MEKKDFIEYMAQRYGINSEQAECMTDIVFDSLQDLITSGESVNIDEIGQFKNSPLFPDAINSDSPLLQQINQKNMFSFHPSHKLLGGV